LLRTILSAAGHEVFVAADGAAALRLLQGQAVELVFCDMLMPVLDGVETIRRLRGVLPAARVVAMSGGSPGAADMLEQALRLGARVRLEKPFTVTQALSAASQALAEG
jgi:CheY-like chemotaxis protein